MVPTKTFFPETNNQMNTQQLNCDFNCNFYTENTKNKVIILIRIVNKETKPKTDRNQTLVN